MVIAANIEVDHGGQSAENQQSMEQSIQIEQVTLPPQTPPDAPPDEVPPDFQEPPPETAPDPDAYALATPPPAIPTPTPLPTPETPPVPQPTTEPTPEPQSSPSPEATPTPGATAEPVPSAEPTPTAAPSPTPAPDARFADLPPQFENLPETEKVAGKVLKDYLEKQNLALPEELPFGFENWEEYAKYINSDYEAEARRLGTLPGATQGSDGGPANDASPSAAPSGAPSAGPNGNNGSGDGSNGSNGSSGGGFKIRIPGSKRESRFDTNLNADDLKDPGFNGDLDSESRLFDNKTLDDLAKTRDLDFDPNRPLSVPTPTPIPLPPIETGDIGVILYLRFEYDRQVFRAQWEKEASNDKKISVQYAPPGQPGAQRSFDLNWIPEFEDNANAIAQAVLQTYERRKQNR